MDVYFYVSALIALGWMSGNYDYYRYKHKSTYKWIRAGVVVFLFWHLLVLYRIYWRFRRLTHDDNLHK